MLTGLAHTERSKVAYDPFSNQTACERRSAKLRALQKTLKPPQVLGDKTGDLLVVSWGSTSGAIQEAVERLQAANHKVSHVHLRFLSPLEPGLPELFAGFRQVMTIEINYSDSVEAAGDGEHRRRAQLATWLRAQTLCDVDCWSNVHGQPLRPA